MKIRKMMQRLYLSVKSFNQTFKYGGINTVTVSNVHYDDLLKGKKILITGAGSGIGFAIADKCVNCGAKVIITGRNEKKLIEAIKKIDSAKAHYIVWDITNMENYEDKFNECLEIFGGEIDVLINNAGVQPKEFFPNVSWNEWERIYNTNSRGTFFMSEFICKQWIKNFEPGKIRKIINISSQGGFVAANYPYRMSKWDVCGLTQGLALNMARYGVIVNGIAPGVVKTQMQQFSLEQKNNTYCEQNILKRVALPEEIAELAAFMLSDACNFMTGQTILADGGYTLKG